MKTQIYFVLGPTASGKSKFALSLANKLNGEIINADSMQIYHELSILTARPTINDQKKINHHLSGKNGFQSFPDKLCYYNPCIQ